MNSELFREAVFDALCACLNLTEAEGLKLIHSDCAAVMGMAMGLELSHKGPVFVLCYKTVQGIQSSSLTQTEVDRLKNRG